MASWRSRSLWTVSTVAAAAAGVALAAGPVHQGTVNEQTLVGGTLTFAWHGDPQRGCAAQGLCGVRGAVTVHLDGFGQLRQGRIRGEIDLVGASATARVVREDPASATGECIDTVSVQDLQVRLRRRGAGAYSALLNGSPISSGRCAGPVNELSRLPLPVRRLHTRRLGFDLRGRAPFTAGPFSGVLISTVVVRPDTRDSGQQYTATGSTPGPAVSVPRVLVERATVRLRLTGPGGSLQSSFSGSPPPPCVPVDSCGASGTLSLGVSGFSRTLVISGYQNVRKRVGSRKALADLRTGRLDVSGTAFAAPVRGTLAEVLARPGGGCRSARSEQLRLVIDQLLTGDSTDSLAVALGSDQASDPLRTHCPGPSEVDIVSNNQDLAPQQLLDPATIPLRALGQRQLTITLRAPGRFSSTGYTGASAGGLRLTLTPLSARGGTALEREAP